MKSVILYFTTVLVIIVSSVVSIADNILSAEEYAPIKIINWNIEGSKYQLNNPKELFHDADLILLTETLNLDRPGHITGYDCYSSPATKPSKHGRPVGGITIYAKKYLDIKVIKKYENRIHLDSIFGHILCYYANPNKSAGDIIGDICKDTCDVMKNVSIIGGDFNCRIDTTNDKSQTLLSFMKIINFKMMNNAKDPTYISHNGASTIDIIFIKNDKLHPQHHNVTVIKTTSRKHQRVLVHAKLKLLKPDIYKLYMKIKNINKDNTEIEDTGKERNVRYKEKTTKETQQNKKKSFFGNLKEKISKWFL